MSNRIDAKGKACPMPVIMAKKEADAGSQDFTLLVDNRTAVENLTRFGKSNGFDIAVMEQGENDFSIRFLKSAEAEASAEAVIDAGLCEDTAAAPGSDRNGTWAVFAGREGIGDGDLELGTSLMKMFFFTLAQGDEIPTYVLFMNGGVKVPVGDNQAIEHLEALRERGTEILVCGTCLNFYNLADDLKVGVVSNMYDIAGAMQAVDKVITL